MKCTKCNEELEENTRYCTNCGEKIEEIDDGKLTYSQNPNIKTSYNKDVKDNETVEYKEKPAISIVDKTKDSKTTASLILAIISWVLMCMMPILALVGLILGITSEERSSRRTTAIVLNAISLVSTILFYLFAIIMGVN